MAALPQVDDTLPPLEPLDVIAAATKAPKMPRVIKKVYKQIKKHPKFPELSDGTRIGFQVAYNGISWRPRENNKWIRMLWKHLYLGEPMTD